MKQEQPNPEIPKKPRNFKILVPLSKGRVVSVYAGKKVADALTEISEDMNLYKGVRLVQVLEAVYDQALKNGRKEVFDMVDAQKGVLLHRNPGQPKKLKKPKVKKENQK